MPINNADKIVPFEDRINSIDKRVYDMQQIMTDLNEKLKLNLKTSVTDHYYEDQNSFNISKEVNGSKKIIETLTDSKEIKPKKVRSHSKVNVQEDSKITIGYGLFKPRVEETDSFPSFPRKLSKDTAKDREEPFSDKITPILSKIKTDIDKILKIVEIKGSVKMSELSALSKLPESKIKQWGEILEKHKLIEMVYPFMREPELRSKIKPTDPSYGQKQDVVEN